MGLAMTGAAVERPNLTYSLLRAVDRPAHEAVDLARRPFLATAAPALLGLFLVSAASALSGLISPAGFRFTARLDALRAVFEALAVVIPGILVFATYLRLKLNARVLLAGISIGMLGAGLVAVCVLPLMAFLVVVSSEAPEVLALPALLVPGLALATMAALPVRVITSLDPSEEALWIARAFAFFLVAVFVLRMQAAFFSLYSRIW
ncbi:MAG TPA: hypothetical protein VK420_14010 [Longimicrobium sp.]|nr:hypothetical protein [Longimicrobium sp.]